MGSSATSPTPSCEDLLGFVEEVQMAARKPIRHGAQAATICEVGEKLLAASPHKAYTHFMAHGMGSSATRRRG